MVWEISAEELLVRYDAGERNFAGVEVIRNHWCIDLEGLDFRGINLRGANLKDANLTGANLTGADLTGAILRSAILEQAIIRDASLYSANLCWANVSEADLRLTRLTHMNASSAVFFGAKFKYGFEYAILADANFRGATISDDVLYAHGNLLWNTTTSEGVIIRGPLYGDGNRISHEGR